MRHFPMTARMALAAAALGAVGTVTACDNDRTAESETPVSEAEVTTDLPETAVSDEQLQASADAAAQVAATPSPQVLAVPVPGGNGAATAGDANRTAANTGVAANTTGQ